MTDRPALSGEKIEISSEMVGAEACSLCERCPLKVFASETILNIEGVLEDVELTLNRARELFAELSSDLG